MCGIAGFFSTRHRRNRAEAQDIATAMADAITHRGPDDYGVWADSDAGIALSQRRLSIIDLSAAGAQPMVSANGRWVITYNGEIYNAEDLRALLPDITFRGHSDTEVILELCARDGVDATLERLIGMFAMAVWDREERQLYLARDRLGIKPLYWCQHSGELLFGSELKSLARHPAFHRQINPQSIHAYLQYAYIPAPGTIYDNVHKLEPGTIATVTASGEVTIRRWWSLAEVARHGVTNRLDLDDTTAIDQLEALAGDAVARRMVADVPLGAFLSGGIDSSLVVALMCAHSTQPVRTFSIGFDVEGFNEAHHAKLVAEHLGTKHTELTVTDKQARDVIPLLGAMYDEPFSDSSQIPTYLVSDMTRRDVTVSLSGDGGDELFAGYNRYAFMHSMWSKLAWLPDSAKRAIAGGIRTLSPNTWTSLGQLIPGSIRPNAVGDKAYKLATILSGNVNQIHHMLVSQWPNPGVLLPGVSAPSTAFTNHELMADTFAGTADVVERMQYLDTITYLPDDILTKVDRASMAVSLEARVPLLDHRLVEFAWHLPEHFKLRGTETKWLLRQVLYRHVPKSLIDRPKMGFGVPVGKWLRGPLKEWAEDLLTEDRLRADGHLEPSPIRQCWAEHLGGQRNHEERLWAVLMFQCWLDAQKNF
jgi:asparagine synthase (glutamine-hydrolysing)